MPIGGNGMHDRVPVPDLDKPVPLDTDRLALAKAAQQEKPPEDKPADPAPAPVVEDRTINIVSPEPTIFEKQVMELRNAPPPPVYVPPAPTERQLAARQAEMEAGARRVAWHAEQQANRPVPPPDPGTGTNTPVFRPGEYSHEKNVHK
jgi:hypothetical protein